MDSKHPSTAAVQHIDQLAADTAEARGAGPADTRTGKPCPKTGIWMPLNQAKPQERRIEKGKPMPQSQGVSVTWRWVPQGKE